MTCSGDGSLRVWDLKSVKRIENDWRDGENRVWAIALCPDGKKLVSRRKDGAVVVAQQGKTGNEWVYANSFRIAVMTSLEISSPKSKSGPRACHYS
jgi:WD40 repeat protein